MTKVNQAAGCLVKSPQSFMPNSSTTPPTPSSAEPVTLIRANSPWWRINFQEIYAYRDLLFIIVKRDLTAVYKQTVLGPLWFIIQPLVTTIVFTIIFGKVARIDVGEVTFYLLHEWAHPMELFQRRPQ